MTSQSAAVFKSSFENSQTPQPIVKNLSTLFLGRIWRVVKLGAWMPIAAIIRIARKIFFSCPSVPPTFQSLPGNILLEIHKQLDFRDAARLTLVNKFQRQFYIDLRNSDTLQLLSLGRQILDLEPQLKVVFPQFEVLANTCEQSRGVGQSSSTFYSSNAQYKDVVESLRHFCVYWAYNHPKLLEKLLLRLGFLPTFHPLCEVKFEELDSNWSTGPIMPHLFDRAILASNIESIRVLRGFIPQCIKSPSNFSDLSKVKVHRANIHFTILCIYRRCDWSVAENKRFAAKFGTLAAFALEKVSPAFAPDACERLQSSVKDTCIYEFMDCAEHPDQLRESADNCCKMLRSKVEKIFCPPSLEAQPTFLQLPPAHRRYIPYSMLGRMLKPSGAFGAPDFDGSWEQRHVFALDLIARGVSHRPGSPLRAASRISAQFLDQLYPCAFDEIPRYSIHYGSRTLTLRPHRSLLETLVFSLYGSVEEVDELRVAIQRFLRDHEPIQGSAFALSKLDTFFDPLAEFQRGQMVSGLYALDISPEVWSKFLIFEWLMVASVSKIFDKPFHMICGIGRTAYFDTEENEKYLECICQELLKYNLGEINLGYYTNEETGVLSISAIFIPPGNTETNPHFLIAQHSAKEPQLYLTPRSHQVFNAQMDHHENQGNGGG